MLKLNIIATQEELCKRNKNLHETKKNITTKDSCRLWTCLSTLLMVVCPFYSSYKLRFQAFLSK